MTFCEQKPMRFVCTALVLLLLAACQSEPLPPLPAWQGSEGLLHADLGRIQDLRSGQSISAAQLLERLADAPLLLIGEQHDNPDHHALELWLLQALPAYRAQGAVLLEMLDDGQQDAVSRTQRALREGQSPDDLRSALNWQPSWNWQAYQALLRHALAQPYPLLAANLERSELMAIYRAPQAPEGTNANAPEVLDALSAQLSESHCHLLPPQQLPAMLAIQQQRDRRMAQRLLAAAKPALLIAGAFHARRDLGVPRHLADLGQTRARVLILAEVGQQVTAQMADFVWYTAALPKQDYCEELRQSLQKPR